MSTATRCWLARLPTAAAVPIARAGRLAISSSCNALRCSMRSKSSYRAKKQLVQLQADRSTVELNRPSTNPSSDQSDDHHSHAGDRHSYADDRLAASEAANDAAFDAMLDASPLAQLHLPVLIHRVVDALLPGTLAAMQTSSAAAAAASKAAVGAVSHSVVDPFVSLATVQPQAGSQPDVIQLASHSKASSSLTDTLGELKTQAPTAKPQESGLPQSSLAPTRPPLILLDATFGAGGHSAALLRHAPPNTTLFAIDRDPDAIQRAEQLGQTNSLFHSSRFRPLQGSFSQMRQLVADQGIQPGSVDGILMDIGFCSTQVDDATRGFSFLCDGPLDMRMGAGTAFELAAIPTAATVLATLRCEELTHILRLYGELPKARAIADAIVRTRKTTPIQSTLQLADIARRAVFSEAEYKEWQLHWDKIKAYLQSQRSQSPTVLSQMLDDDLQDSGLSLDEPDAPDSRQAPQPRQNPALDKPGAFRFQGRKVKDPARQVFQALRVFVNDEISELRAGLGQAIALLRPGGRLAVITFQGAETTALRRFLQSPTAILAADSVRSLDEDAPAASNARSADSSRPRHISLNDRFLAQKLQEFEQMQSNNDPTHFPTSRALPLTVLHKAIGPSEHEIHRNPRARSAKLHVFERSL
ncbi:methyltransferase [Capsaspora owczarzaki ATCC 30864]|uniref:Methyltransferase n=1 Tax=Capsaspora owczarzaki (strain ATCC 30864) TaxID=595528 RepID=A0A0D2WP94_CAPO3|nr:methyltransferase [Capsaspora owczarzaki ATCC 30864]KJE93105.1 methyltransferase [Capsaspora owczarzaki ATCC 30864]|eukprot:XP_004363671.2 methyltransferase [Capsaspora owczarzaki ATCC 30864]